MLRDQEKHSLRVFLSAQDTWDGYVTGGCIGIDHFCGVTLVELFPHKHHIVIVPANRSRVAAWWRLHEGTPGLNLEVREMSPGTDYKMRNQALVNTSSLLAGFPDFPEWHRASTRSGTWQTIRMARQAFRDGRHRSTPIVTMLSTLAA